MNKTPMLLLGVLLIGLTGCRTTPLGPILNRETYLYDRQFNVAEYYDEYGMFATRESPWLCIMTYTEVLGGKLNDLRPGSHIAYDASAFDLVYDNMGFNHFVWFADRIIILKEKAQTLGKPPARKITNVTKIAKSKPSKTTKDK